MEKESKNLTVETKGDVYVRIGDTVKKVKGTTKGVVGTRTGGLSATLHFTDGTSEDATGKDYFVYIKQ